MGAQGRVGEPAEDGVEGAHRTEEGDHAADRRNAARGALAVMGARHDDGLERLWVGQARCAFAEGGQEALVDLGSRCAKARQFSALRVFFRSRSSALFSVVSTRRARSCLR